MFSLQVVCRRCHVECESCKHAGDGNCDKNACVHFEQEGRCVPACEPDYFNDDNVTCHKCSPDTLQDNCPKISEQIKNKYARNC